VRFLLPLCGLLLLGCPSAPTEAPEPVTAPAPAEPPRREPVIVMPVPEKAAEGSARFKADWSFDIRDEEHFSVHVHVIPPGQMVPLHQHPENWELSFVAEGVAQWSGVAVIDGERARFGGELGVGDGFVAPPGAFHEVRNRGAERLSVIVVHQPRFGQNWYVPEAEVLSNVRAVPLGDAVDGPDGWSVQWVGPSEATAAGDRVLLMLGEGALEFEDKRVPVGPGFAASLPPGLPHALRGEGVKALAIEVPRR
jgi:mannose-6-phosphate isomerase-like protein (cupin superfamily)